MRGSACGYRKRRFGGVLVQANSREEEEWGRAMAGNKANQGKVEDVLFPTDEPLAGEGVYPSL